MSYDVWVECPQCGMSGTDWNYTSNLVGAWCEAGADLAEFDGKSPAECAAVLLPAIERMAANREEYARRFNPSNGWGSVETLIPRLQELLTMLRQAKPGTIVRVCR